MINEKRLEWWRTLGIAPAVVDLQDTAFILNLHEDAVLYLTKVGHLLALGNPPPSSQRYFSTQYILALAKDDKWLHKSLRLVRENHKLRNSGVNLKGR